MYITKQVSDCPILEREREWDTLDEIQRSPEPDPFFALTHSEFIDAVDGTSGAAMFSDAMAAWSKGDDCEAGRIIRQQLERYTKWLD